MALRQCEKCSEMVDEAKAFCPGCGHAFVQEEKRSNTSNFELMDNTVQLGQTMYNQMLSDMGLNISKAPDQPEKRIEVIVPVATEVRPANPPIDPPKVQPKPAGNRTKWIIAGIAVVILFFLLAVVITAAGFIYWTKFR